MEEKEESQESPADAVLFTFERLGGEGGVGGSYDFIESMDKKDDYTIEIMTKAPYGALKERLCEYKTAIVSPSNDFETTLIGTGPFKFKETQKDVKNVVERNDSYWSGEVKLAGAEFYPGEDEMTRAYRLYNQEVDYAMLDIPITEYDTAKSYDFLDVDVRDADYTHIMILNTTKAPFDKVEVRHAISDAIDWEALVDAIYGEVEGGLASYGVVPVKYSWSDPDACTAKYDPEEAKELLAKNGIEDTDGDGMLEYKGEPFTLTIMTYDTGLYKQAVEILQSQLKELGITAEAEITTWDETDRKMSEKSYDINFDSVPFLEFASPVSLENYFATDSYQAAGAGYGDGSIRYMVLPAISMSLMSFGTLMKMMRNAMAEVLDQEYIVTAEAKGLKGGTVIWRHTLRNAMIPVVTLAGMTFASMLAGSAVTEEIFSWPGIGHMILEGIQNKDFPVVQACVLCVSAIYLGMNFLVDFLYAVLNPRIRYD